MAPLTHAQRRLVATNIALVPVASRRDAFLPIAELLGVQSHELDTELALVAHLIPPPRYDLELIAVHRLHLHAHAHALPCSLQARACNHFFPL